MAGRLVAVLFAAAGPLSVPDAARVLQVAEQVLEAACRYLAERPPLGLALVRDRSDLYLTTSPECAAEVERLLGTPSATRLSRAALEVLAIVAYRQPVTRGEIDAVRGVNSDSALGTLLTRGLVAEIGHRESIGRPALLATTPDFLLYLGVPSLEALPPLPTG